MNQSGGVLSRAFVAHRQTAEVLQRGVGPLDDPLVLVASQLSAVLMRGDAVIRPRRDDRLDVTLLQQRARRIAVATQISNQPLRLAALCTAVPDAPVLQRRFQELDPAGDAFSTCIPSGVPAPSANTMSFVPLPLLVFPTSAPPF
jgi:hypothetical protein